jgi:hypothetical protein
MPPILLVSVDTEEEFDWSAPFSPAQRSVGHAARLPRLHELFERFGVRPTYLVDHPIATTEQSVRVLDGFLQKGNCEIGAHLHPWVNPPLVEDDGKGGGYLCNLPLPVQQDKLANLTEAIGKAFGVRPAVFRCGRYGLDFALVPVLRELGYHVDSSIMAYTSFTGDGGPSWEGYGPEPFWLRPPLVPETPGREPLLEVPCTTAFTRRPFWFWAALSRLFSRRPWSHLRLIGILWRLGVRRIRLTPEGPDLSDLIGVMRAVTRGPNPVLTMILHSPSIEPGHTPYVRSERDLERFYAVLAGTLEFAVGRLGARCLTLGEFDTHYRSTSAVGGAA